jgi:hypothetical protein
VGNTKHLSYFRTFKPFLLHQRLGSTKHCFQIVQQLHAEMLQILMLKNCFIHNQKVLFDSNLKQFISKVYTVGSQLGKKYFDKGLHQAAVLLCSRQKFILVNNSLTHPIHSITSPLGVAILLSAENASDI